MEETINQYVKPNIRFQQNFVSANIVMLALAGSIVASKNYDSPSTHYNLPTLEQNNSSNWNLNNSFKESLMQYVVSDDISQTQILTAFVEEFLSESIDLDPEISQMVSNDFWELF
jgi:hypothetical protein